MTRSEKIDLLENFSTFLAANGYMDEDWRSEPPFAIDEFLRLTPDPVEPTADESTTKCSICGIPLFDTKIFIDGDFNKSYESRVKNAKGRNIGKSVEPTANEGEKTAEDFINKIEDHHIAFMEDYAGGKESHYSREGIIKAMQAYASQERSKAIQEALNLPKRKIAENNWDGVKFRPTNEEYIAVKDLEKLNQK